MGLCSMMDRRKIDTNDTAAVMALILNVCMALTILNLHEWATVCVCIMYRALLTLYTVLPPFKY